MADENKTTMSIFFESLWCVSCGCVFQVTVGMMNGRRDGQEPTYCPGCGRRYNRHGEGPAAALERVENAIRDHVEEEARLLRVNASLRGTITRMKKGRGTR